MQTERVRRSRNVAARGTATTVTVAGITLTHPDRILYPEQRLTKRELARYYESVAEWCMPYLIGRPLTLVRCPQGHNRECFYQKHANESIPDAIDRVQIKEEDRGQGVYLIANTISAVVGLVQMGVLEIHTWGSREDQLDRPDRIIFDFDPDPGLPWKQVLAVASTTRVLLTELGLESFIKTTGGKGLHIVLPIQRIHTWEEIKTFAKAVAEFVARADPAHVTAAMAKTQRKRKVYIDYLRNARGATAIAVFSTRARPGAPVSVPLSWDELTPSLRSDQFTVKNVGTRLKNLRQDPWKEYDTVKQRLTKTMWKKLS